MEYIFGWFSTKDSLFHFGESELIVGSLLELWRVGLHCLVDCDIIKCGTVSLCTRVNKNPSA